MAQHKEDTLVYCKKCKSNDVVLNEEIRVVTQHWGKLRYDEDGALLADTHNNDDIPGYSKYSIECHNCGNTWRTTLRPGYNC